MKLKKYHAYTMAEALNAVKSDLGADAVILHTRTFRRGGILGLWRKTVVEVTATPAVPQQAARRPLQNSPQPKLAHVQASRAYAASSPDPARTKQTRDGSTQDLNDDRERTRRLALALEEAHRRRAAEPLASTAPGESKLARADVALSTASSISSAPATQTARRYLLTSPQSTSNESSGATAKSASDTAQVANPSENRSSSADEASAMQDELNAIKQMVGQVLRRQASSGHAPSTMPKQLFEMYLKLIEQDISDDLADQIIEQVREELSSAELDDAELVRAAALRRLASFIPVSEDSMLSHLPSSGPLIIALIGPTGVGKTTTLAKLAATLKLHEGRSVGLITADTYRIAAVDQLRTYADILGLPLQVALTPAEMKRSIAALSDRDVILIDTAGRSQRDTGRLDELKRFIAAAQPTQVHLVLSSTAGEKVLLQEAEAFSAVGVHKIVLTKLDEAVSFGILVNVIRRMGKELSFITTGQEVPDHIEVGRADRLAELVLSGTLQREVEPRSELVRA